jgi:hypothetical protein
MTCGYGKADTAPRNGIARAKLTVDTERLTAIVQAESAETAQLTQDLGEFEGMDSDGESGTWTKIYSRNHVHFRAPGEHDLGALAFEGW